MWHPTTSLPGQRDTFGARGGLEQSVHVGIGVARIGLPDGRLIRQLARGFTSEVPPLGFVSPTPPFPQAQVGGLRKPSETSILPESCSKPSQSPETPQLSAGGGQKRVPTQFRAPEEGIPCFGPFRKATGYHHVFTRENLPPSCSCRKPRSFPIKAASQGKSGVGSCMLFTNWTKRSNKCG